MLASTLALYTLVAACSVSAGTATNGGSGPGAEDLADAIANPVSDAKAAPITSGTRLKAVYVLGADGSKQVDPNVFWDSQRNEQCTFQTVASGEMYCLPAAQRGTFNELVKDYTIFSDSSCTAPLAGIYTREKDACTQQPTAKYLVKVVNEACKSGLILGIYTPTATRVRNPVYRKSIYNAAVCESTSYGTADEVYMVGAEVPLSAFVKGTAGHE